MTKQEVAALAIRFLALWVFTEVGAALSTLAFGLLVAIGRAEAGQTLAMLITGVPSIALCAIGVWLWRRADFLAMRMTDAEPSLEAGPIAKPNDLLTVAYSILGMYFVVSALPEVAAPVAQAVYAEVPFSRFWTNAGWQIRVWVPAFQCLLGAWLLLGSRGIVRAVGKLQRPAVEGPAENDASAAQ